MTLNKTLILNLIVIISLTIVFDSFSQGQKKIIQLSGVVVGQDSISGVGGVHVYVPKAGRGTTSNPYGYFAMPVLAEDSIIVSAIGYQKQSFIMPGDKGVSVTLFIELKPDTTILPELEIFPYPTEELFKKAVLAVELPNRRDIENLEKSLDKDLLRRMYNNEPMSANMNYKYFMDQQMMATSTKYQLPSNPLLNPFAWVKFIKAIKRGDFKRKD
ncbi:MAG: carboxypeptidase-like regulatory domain-containing protein [Cytophagales bacterium]|nr:MAG: membrane receptor RagA [Rhodothermaeota bacterium MED-G16]|tara:strand:+ start:714 stop:1358 length:645 start_codon:yes stop_codon:yes gene_type:complete